MALSYLADTSVLTRLREPSVREGLAPRVERGEVARAGITDLARQVQRLLASKHQRGRKVPDLLLAAAAEARSLVVLHYDADFDRIAAVTGQGSSWIVEAGSID
jgi:predicted nucleic acid-binding protein